MQEILVAFERKIENYSGKFQVVVEVSHWHEELPGTTISLFNYEVLKYIHTHMHTHVQLRQFEMLVFVFYKF